MEKRCHELSVLHDFIEEVDKEVKTILQNLKWDRKRLLEDVPKATCSYDKSHKLAPDKMECHERQCFLKSHSYNKDLLLPDPLHADANTLIKLDKQAIVSIINNATCGNPLFKQECQCMINLYFPVVNLPTVEKPYSSLFEGIRSQSPEPWTLERLQSTYTTDERRALHDAVVQAVPSCHDLADLALPSTEDGAENPKVKSREEILAELRDMKRRRAKYRVAAKTRKYSDVLRDVIKTQMELYTDALHTTTASPEPDKSMRHQRDNREEDSFSLKQGTSSRDNGGEYSQNENLSCNFPRRNSERRTERHRSTSRDRRGREQLDYYSNSYVKNKDRITPEKRERYNRNDYSTSSYEHRKDKNYSSREKREKQSRDYSSSSIYEQNKYREPTLPEDTRETRRRHEHTITSRDDEYYDDETRKRRKKDRSKKRHRDNRASSERDEVPPKRKHKKTKNRHSHRKSRERNTEGDGKIRVKSERDETPGRDLSETETRYHYVYANSRPKRGRERSEKNYHKSRDSKNRKEETNISVKIERETPEQESYETQSNYTRPSTYIDDRRRDYSSSSEDTNSRRDGRIGDYKHSHKRDKYEQTNDSIKKERDETAEQEYYHHHHTTKRNRKKHSRRNRSSEESDRSRSRDRESRHANRHKSGYGNDREDIPIKIKEEKDDTP